MKHGIHEVTSFEELRDIRSSVLGASDFSVEHRCLVPDISDSVGLNLGRFENGKLLSTFRALPVFTARELEENLDFPKVLELEYPGVVFGKASSVPEARGRGYIRELFFEMMRRSAGYKFVALTTKPSNPLNDFLLQEGFERILNPDGWHRFGYQSHGPTYVFIKKLFPTSSLVTQ
ncbi:MAG: hypothetical protein ACJ76H_14215 [Bacteriovoracaceae bacterium]